MGLETERLLLRQWRKDDYSFFAQMNADPKVMEYYPNIMSKSESDDFASKIESLIMERGWGLWAVELKKKSPFIGYIGLHIPSVELPFNPCVEIGWRLSKEFWGNGYAPEGATKVLTFAFDDLGLSEIVSFTTHNNKNSQRVMQKINMVDTKQNFIHPAVPDGCNLKEHVLYKITKEQWENAM
jgi:RimJ/RimL family protein N-acetyltransferase